AALPIAAGCPRCPPLFRDYFPPPLRACAARTARPACEFPRRFAGRSFFPAALPAPWQELVPWQGLIAWQHLALARRFARAQGFAPAQGSAPWRVLAACQAPGVPPLALCSPPADARARRVSALLSGA